MSGDNVTPIATAPKSARRRGLSDEQVTALEQAIAIIEVIQQGALGGAITTETSLAENALQRSLQAALNLLYTLDPDHSKEPAEDTEE